MHRTTTTVSVLIATVVTLGIPALTSTYSDSLLSSDSTTIAWWFDGDGDDNGGGDDNWWQ